MLKVLKASVVIATVSLTMSGAASANTTLALQTSCSIVNAEGESTKLRKKALNSEAGLRVRLDDQYGNAACGSNNFVRAALLKNAIESGTLMVRKMPANGLRTTRAGW